MIRWLVLRIGRTNTVILLISVGLVLLLLIHHAAEQQAGIDPNEALAHGGHIVTVHTTRGPSTYGLPGHYQVKTLAGQPPKQRSGEFSDDINVVVGPDWIGQIKVTMSCGGWSGADWSGISDPIGGAFGWDDQTVDIELFC